MVVSLEVVDVSFTHWQSQTCDNTKEHCRDAERKQYAVLKLSNGQEMKVDLATRAVQYRNGVEKNGGQDYSEEELWEMLLKKAPELEALRKKK